MWEPIGTGQAAGVTGYLLRRGMPVLLSRDDHQRLVEQGEVEVVGIPGTDWMGAPLLADGLTVGAVVVQSYREDRRHTATDLELLTFVARHIATALTRARAIEETRQRNAELAVINEIGEGLAKQLDFTAIIDLVGERIGEVFASNSVSIALYDADTNLLSFPYSMDRGTRLPDDSYELGPGLDVRDHPQPRSAADGDARRAPGPRRGPGRALRGRRGLERVVARRPDHGRRTRSGRRLPRASRGTCVQRCR